MAVSIETTNHKVDLELAGEEISNRWGSKFTFKPEERLGSGITSDVYNLEGLADDGFPVCVKIIKFDEESPNGLRSLISNIQDYVIHKILDEDPNFDPSVCNMYDIHISRESGQAYILMQQLVPLKDSSPTEDQSTENELQLEVNTLPEEFKIKIFQQYAQHLKKLAEKGILLGDIRTANLGLKRPQNDTSASLDIISTMNLGEIQVVDIDMSNPIALLDKELEVRIFTEMNRILANADIDKVVAPEEMDPVYSDGSSHPIFLIRKYDSQFEQTFQLHPELKNLDNLYWAIFEAYGEPETHKNNDLINFKGNQNLNYFYNYSLANFFITLFSNEGYPVFKDNNDLNKRLNHLEMVLSQNRNKIGHIGNRFTFTPYSGFLARKFDRREKDVIEMLSNVIRWDMYSYKNPVVFANKLVYVIKPELLEEI